MSIGVTGCSHAVPTRSSGPDLSPTPTPLAVGRTSAAKRAQKNFTECTRTVGRDHESAPAAPTGPKLWVTVE